MKKKNLLVSAIAIFGLASMTFGQTVPSYVPTNGLVGWWPFNENANDESGNNNNGSVNGATLTSDRFGNNNSAFSFDGVDDWIEIQNSASLNPNEISFNLWVYPLNDNLCLIGKLDHSNAAHHSYTLTHNEIWNGNNGLRTSWSDGDCLLTGSVANWGPIDVVSNNSWTMVTVLISSSGVCKQFINSILNYEFSLAAFATCDDASSNLGFGYHYLSDPKWMEGYLDDIGIWNRALTQQEITDLYNGCQISVINQPVSQTININNNVQFMLGTSTPNITYQWQTDLGVGFQNIDNIGQYSGTTNDTLTVSNVIMTNNNQPFRCIISSDSCTDTSAVAVLTVINTAAINGVSQSNLFSVYPNPANSQINVKVDPSLVGSVYTAYDNTGRIVFLGKIESANTILELENLSGGTYLFTLGENLKQTFNVFKE